MTAKDNLEQKLNKLAKAIGTDEKLIEKVMSRINSKTQSDADLKNNGRTIMKNPAVKLAIAAVIIFAFTIFVFKIFPNINEGEPIPSPNITSQELLPPPIEIPQELADMSVEELLALHYNPQNSSYDPEVVEAALKQALDKLDSSQVMTVARVFTGLDVPQGARRGGGRGAMVMQYERVGGFGGGPREYPVTTDIANYNWMPVYNFLVNKQFRGEIVEENPNLFVNARLLSVMINVDDIKQALVKKWRILTEWMDDRYRATVLLEVLNTSPKDVIQKGRIIEVPILIEKAQLERLKIGGQYFIGMLQTKNGIEFLPYMRGVFEVTPTNDADSLTTQFWSFLCDTQDILLFANTPQQEIIDYWTLVLNTEAFEMALVYMNILPKELMPAQAARDTVVQRLLNEESYEKAFDYLAMLPDELIPAQAIVDVVEQKYQSLAAQLQQKNAESDSGQPTVFISPTANIFNIEKPTNLLVRSADKDAIARMIALLEQDRQGNDGGIFWSSVSYRRSTNRPSTIQLLIALEKDNPGNLFVNIYDKYKDNPIITKVYESSSEFANELLSIILDQVGKPINENIYSMILEIIENPSEYKIEKVEVLKKMWTILSSSGNFDIRSYLVDFINNTDLSGIGIVLASDYPPYIDPQFDFERAACEILMQLPTDQQLSHKEQLDILLKLLTRHKDNGSCISFVVINLRDIIQKNDIDAIPLLSELLLNEELHWDVPNIITKYIPDPAFIPVLQQALERGFNDDLLNLLVVCGDNEGAISIARQQTEISGGMLNALFEAGDEDTAIQLALDRLQTPIRTGNRNNYDQDIRLFTEIISLLGKSKRPELTPVVEVYADNEFLNSINIESFSAFRLKDLYEAIISALARLGGKDAIGRLRQIYETNEDIYIRQIAALALYYIGDDTGWEIIEPLINKTYIEHSEAAIKLGRDFSMNSILQNPIVRGMLGSDRTDALLIEKMSNYVDQPDQYALFVDAGNKDDTTEFFERHKNQIMPILVEQLSNPSATTRAESISFLRKITKQNFGFQPKIQYSQQQIIQKWKDYIAKEY